MSAPNHASITSSTIISLVTKLSRLQKGEREEEGCPNFHSLRRCQGAPGKEEGASCV